MEIPLEETLDLSRDAALLIAAGSIAIAFVALLITIVALFMSASAVRGAARENRLTKEIERDLATRGQTVEWLLMANGMGRARRTDPDGIEYPDHHVQVFASVMLRNYPEAREAIAALRDQWKRQSSDSAKELAETLNQSLDYIKKQKG